MKPRKLLIFSQKRETFEFISFVQLNDVVRIETMLRVENVVMQNICLNINTITNINMNIYIYIILNEKTRPKIFSLL